MIFFFFFFEGSGERGEKFALMKNGAPSKEGGREGRHENVIKTCESNWCSQWKMSNVPWRGIRWHTQRPRCPCASQLLTKHLPGCPACAPRAGAEPEPQQPLLSVLPLTHEQLVFWHRTVSPQSCQLTMLWRTFLWWAEGPFAHLPYSPQRGASII